MERRERAAAARKETEARVAAQAAEVEARKRDIEARDAAREKHKVVQQLLLHSTRFDVRHCLQQAEAAAARAAANEEAHRRAAERIQGTLAAKAGLMAARRAAFDAKQAANQARRLAREAAEAQEAAQRRAEEAAQHAHRQAAYAEAQHKQVGGCWCPPRPITRCLYCTSRGQPPFFSQQQRVEAIVAEERAREEAMRAREAERQREKEAQQVARTVNQRLRVSKVQAMQRVQAFQRHEALGMIEQETQRARQLLAERAALQEERRKVNMEASFQRQQVLEAMAMLAKAPGKVDVHSVLKQHV